MFTCYIGTDNDNFARVKKNFLEELNRIRDEAPKPQEVEDAKTYLLGNMALRFTTYGGRWPSKCCYVHRHHLGVELPQRLSQGGAGGDAGRGAGAWRKSTSIRSTWCWWRPARWTLRASHSAAKSSSAEEVTWRPAAS